MQVSLSLGSRAPVGDLGCGGVQNLPYLSRRFAPVRARAITNNHLDPV